MEPISTNSEHDSGIKFTVTADFIAVYTPGFSVMIRPVMIRHLITWRIASQYVNGCKSN